MDLRLELEAAHRRIAELEHQLEAYRKAEHVSMSGLTSNSTAQTTVFKSSVITRAAAAALKKSSGFDVKDVSMRRPKQLSKKLAPHATPAHCPPLQPKPHIPSSKFMHVQNPAQSLESITFDNATSKIDLKTRSKSMPKILRPAATIVHQRFSPSPAAVPLKPKLAIDKAKRVSSSTLQSNGKFASTNVLSPVSTFSDDNNSTSSPSSSTNAKKVVVEVKSLPAKTAMRGGKSSKKERSTLVAKCTEPRAGQTRYWTQEEHERFLEAVAQYGEKAYVAISNYVETRTPKQVRTHAQKFQMKMARLARQSAETGEPLQLPPGMLPIVIEGVPKKKPVGSPMSDSMATDAEPGCSSESCDAEMASSTGADATAEESTEVSPATCGEAADVVGEAASSVSDVSCDDLTDPYLSYIGGDGEGCEKEGLEDCFAAKLSKTFQNGTMGMAVKGEILSLDEVGSIKTGRVEHDDDLEDLEDCGELPMASLSNFGI